MKIREKNIICWGLGRHFYSTTYHFLEMANLIPRVRCLVDSNVKGVDKRYAEKLSGCPIIVPDDIKDWVDDNTIILISVADYGAIVDVINANPDIQNVDWLPDRFLAMLQTDDEILNVPKTPNAPKPYHKNSEIRIPKIINTFWFSNDPIPEKYQKCVDSWKKYCPDYEIRIWSLNDYNPHGNRYFEEAISVKKWAFASDFSRIDIICQNGGVYMDLDVEVVKPLDDLLHNDAYLGFEDFIQIDCGSGFGATKGNKIFEEIRDEYKDRVFILPDGSFDQTTCPKIYTPVLERHGLKRNGSFQEVEDITVYPFEYLSAKSFLTGIIYQTENTYTIHHHEGSWLTEESKRINSSRYNAVDEFRKLFQL